MQRFKNILLSVTLFLLISISDQYGSRIQESLTACSVFPEWFVNNNEHLSGSAGILYQEKVTDILGLPVDKTLSELEIKNFRIRLSPKLLSGMAAIQSIQQKQYFSRSKSIIPGLVSTSIGYPFHYFF